MVDTVRQLCIESIEIVDSEGTRFKIEQGKDYLTTIPEYHDDNIILFSRYWVSVPKKNFVVKETQ